MGNTERVRGGADGGEIVRLDTVDSTNRWARDAARRGAAAGLVVVSDHQHSGRGRLGRRWEAPPGTGLAVSILFRPAALAPDRYHLLTGLVALAAQDACRAVGGFTPELKWPNDLLVADRKLAGILGEAEAGAVVVGLGLNLTAGPPGAVTAEEAAGRPVARDDLLDELLAGIAPRDGRWDAVAAEFTARCATVGRSVAVQERDGELQKGRAVRIDAAGRLVVAFDGEAGERAVAAGDVTHVRPG